MPRAAIPAGQKGSRRLLLAIIRDLRVVFILLARQLVEMRAAGDLPEEERRALAQLTADIHAPLANRLGIWQLKWELEDLAFQLPATRCVSAHRAAARRAPRRSRKLDRRNQEALESALAKAGVKADIAGRSKHIYLDLAQDAEKGRRVFRSL